MPEENERIAGGIMAAAFRVHRTLGAGFKESVYRKCLIHALRRDGFDIREEPPLAVEFEGLLIEDAGRPDLVVNDRVIVELKVAEGFNPVHAAQVINYLKASNLLLGLLINFNVVYLRDGMRRYVHPQLLKKAGEDSPLGS